MKRILAVAVLGIVVLLDSGCVGRFAAAQSQSAGHGAQPQGENPAAAAEGQAQEGGEPDIETALKESGAVKKVGGWLGIKNTKTAYWVFTFINFGILALALGAAMKKILPGKFRSRGESIQRSIEDARKASAEANTRLAAIEQRLGRLDTEIASIRSTAEEQGRAEEQRLLAATEDEKQKIVRSAEQEIAAASAAAQRELKQFAADLAVSLAEKKISVSDNADRGLVRQFTQGLSDGSGGGRA